MWRLKKWMRTKEKEEEEEEQNILDEASAVYMAPLIDIRHQNIFDRKHIPITNFSLILLFISLYVYHTRRTILNVSR